MEGRPCGEKSNLKSVMEMKNRSVLDILSRLLYCHLISSLTSVLQRYSVLTPQRQCFFKEIRITIKSSNCFSLHVRYRHVLSVLTIHIKSQEVKSRTKHIEKGSPRSSVYQRNNIV